MENSIIYHEAGHVAMFLHLNRPFAYASIIPNNETAGRVTGVCRIDDESEMVNNCLILLAGCAAERIAYGGSIKNVLKEDVQGGDLWLVANNLKNHPNIGQAFRSMNETTEYCLKNLWWKVEAIAQALKQNQILYYQDCKRIWEQ
jgi:hypothetical protein